MKPSELLQQVLTLLGPNGEHWTQTHLACDSINASVDSRSDTAVKWCVLGAIEYVAYHNKSRQRLYYYLRNAVGDAFTSITGYNDSVKTFDEIREWLTGAIALAKAAEQ